MNEFCALEFEFDFSDVVDSVEGSIDGINTEGAFVESEVGGKSMGIVVGYKQGIRLGYVLGINDGFEVGTKLGKVVGKRVVGIIVGTFEG